MTPEDLEKIRNMVRSEIDRANHSQDNGWTIVGLVLMVIFYWRGCS